MHGEAAGRQEKGEVVSGNTDETFDEPTAQKTAALLQGPCYRRLLALARLKERAACVG